MLKVVLLAGKPSGKLGVQTQNSVNFAGGHFSGIANHAYRTKKQAEQTGPALRRNSLKKQLAGKIFFKKKLDRFICMLTFKVRQDRKP